MGNGKVALITGGASGIGLATGRLLRSRGWTIAIIDFNPTTGSASAAELSGTFHRADVSDAAGLGRAFADAWAAHRRFDFVFANAGIVERFNFYAGEEKNEESERDGKGGEDVGHGKEKTNGEEKGEATGAPPPPLDLRVLQINLLAVIQTVHYAQHYFRLNPPSVVSPSLVLTASTGALYATPQLPCYSAAKFGVFGLCISVAPVMWAKDRVRVAAICPGSVRTALLEKEGWDVMPEEYFTEVDVVAGVVAGLVEDEEGGAREGKGVKGMGWNRGRVVEICGKGIHERSQLEYGDKRIETLMETLADVAVKEF